MLENAPTPAIQRDFLCFRCSRLRHELVFDETYLKVRVRWTYLHRATGWDGNLIDATLSEHRDMQAAKAFFRSARATVGFRPAR